MYDLHEARPLATLVSEVAQDAQALVRGEVALAKLELDRKLEHTVVAMIWTFGGMFVGFAGLIILLSAAVDALAYAIPLWAAALVIGILVIAVGGGLSFLGVRMLAPSELAPHRLLRNLGRDARLVKEHA